LYGNISEVKLLKGFMKMAGIYIHVPFCTKKCFYCDFYSIETLKLFGRYLDALGLELELKAESFEGDIPEISTVYFGGGTPSLMYPEQLQKIIEKINTLYPISKNAEWTLEANPGTYDIERLKYFKQAGINRLSIGVQSFNDMELLFLQRIHNSKEAIEGIMSARLAGFDNISIDLITSIPGQTPEMLKNTIKHTLDLMPEHISAYSLIYEPGTPLYEQYLMGLVEKIEDDTDASLYELIAESFTNSGFEQYEVSNFSLPGFRSIHNLNYWLSCDYFAFGPSAHGFYKGERYWNVKSLDLYYQYIKTGRLPLGGSEILTFEDKINEGIMLGLRSIGINFSDFKNTFGIDLVSKAGDLFESWKAGGLCSLNDEKIILNYKGYAISNTLISQLLKITDKLTK
jgi:oxygen-independent coproporphyrinogen III oxidase